MAIGKKYLAIDFGASNGRAIIGEFDGRILKFKEVYRFENRPVFAGETLYWDFLRLFSELKISIKKAVNDNKSISSLAVDTWGVDYGLLDSNLELISNPVHYRDKRTTGMPDKVFKIMGKEEIYCGTGVQFMDLNTIFQLYAHVLKNSKTLKNTKHFLMIGDLFNFFLTGNISCEYTNVTTTQIYDQKNKRWNEKILKSLDIPVGLFPEVREPGTIIGRLNDNILSELECSPIQVSLAAYDTSSEITAIPVSQKNRDKSWAYFSCGTWAMIGIISDIPIICKEGMQEGFGNEGGVAGKYHYLKNMIGLWIIQQCRKKWIEETGRDISWTEIISQAKDSKDYDIFIDVDHPSFEKEIFDMPEKVLEFLRKSNQDLPETIGETARCLIQSLVLKYVLNLRKLERIIDRKIEFIRIVGGGSKNRLLCQWVADASGIEVIAGPVEATTSGNILLQMLAVGDIKSIEEGREILEESVKTNYYKPGETDKWDSRFRAYKKLISDI